jgi:hypothetical protein
MTESLSASERSRWHATTARLKTSPLPRSRAASAAHPRRSRPTTTTHLRLTKDLRIAPALTSASAQRALAAAPRAQRLPRGLSRVDRTPRWRGGAALRPIPACARAYGGGAETRARACSAPRDRPHRCCEIVRRGSAAPRAGVRIAAAGCSERTSRRSGAGHDQAVDAATATVALRKRGSSRRESRSSRAGPGPRTLGFGDGDSEVDDACGGRRRQ